MTSASAGSCSHSGVPTEPLDISPTSSWASSSCSRRLVGRFRQMLAPNAHIGALEGAQGRSPGDETSAGDRRICSDRHRLPNRPRYCSALPRRIARYPRRHPGHRLGRRRDGLLRGAGQRCEGQTDRRGAVRADQDRQREEVTMPDRNNVEPWEEDDRLPTHAKVRAVLENVAKRRIPITYQELAKALQILPPHFIHRATEALERLMEEDAATERPFIAALAISKARGGLPAPGFF